jgi:hypothetical protein
MNHRQDYRPIKKVNIDNSPAYELALDQVSEVLTEAIVERCVPLLEEVGGISPHPQVHCGIIVSALIGCIGSGVGNVHSLNGVEDTAADMNQLCCDIQSLVNRSIVKYAPLHRDN